MGKPKQPDPEPEKLVRTLGNNLTIAVTDEEKKYRNKNGPDDISELSKDKIKCTVCAKSLADLVKKATDPYIHMLLNVLVCEECSSFYGDGYFSVDEDGDDKYCRWCGQGGTLYLCSTCTCAFCKKCIKLNLSRSELKELESDDWKCLFCNPKPLYECRTICWALQEHAKAMKSKKGNESESEEATSSRSSRGRSKRNANSEGSKSNPKKRKATEVSDDSDEDQKRGSKRRKSSDSNKMVEEAPSRRSRRKSDEKESPKKQAKTEAPSRKGKEVDPPPAKKPSRTTKSKPEEIVISDSDNDGETLSKVKPKITSPNKSTIKTSKKGTPLQDEKKERPKRSIVDKTPISPAVDTPKRSSRKADKRAESGKNVQSLSDEEDDRPSKPGPKSSKNKRSATKSRSSKSSNDTDSKKKSSRRKSEVNDSLDTSLTSTLPLDKNADSTVVQASVYINSALKDVRELSVLISNRCEKLCSKSVQSNEDVLTVFTKLKQMMGGVHANLELIEKGLNTKINGWKIQNDEVKEADKEKTDKEVKYDSNTKDKVEVIDNVSTPKSQEEESGGEEPTEKVPKTEEMEVDEIKVEKKPKLEEMEVDDSQDKVLNSAINNALVTLGEDSNSNEKEEVPASNGDELKPDNEEVEGESKEVEDEKEVEEKEVEEKEVEEKEVDEKEAVGEKRPDEVTEAITSTENEAVTSSENEAVTSSENEAVTSSKNNEVLEEQQDKCETDNEEEVEDEKSNNEEEVEDEKSNESEADEEKLESTIEESNADTSNKDDASQDESENKLESEESNEENVDSEENPPNTSVNDEEEVADNAAADCTPDASDVKKMSSIETSLPCIAAESEVNGLSSSDEVNKILGEEDPFSEELTGKRGLEKKEDNSVPDQNLDISETEQVTSDDNQVSSSQQNKVVDDFTNGTADGGLTHSKVEEKKEDLTRNESSESRSLEKKDESISSRTSFDSPKTNPGSHVDTPRIGTPGRHPQDGHGSRPHDRDSHRGHRDSWGRDRYNRDRWSGSGSRGGSWNRYEDRRQGPPHWGWNR